MPNHCFNKLKVMGKKSDKAEFVAWVKAEFLEGEQLDHLDFDKVIPYAEPYKTMDAEHVGYCFNQKDMSEKEREALAAKAEVYKIKWGTDKDGFNSGGYEWCIANWGTKWRGYSASFEDAKNLLTFETAWEPPIPILKALSQKFPNCTFKLNYYERGCGFCGEMKVKNGETIDDILNSNYRGPYGG
jgi:hypothetical protein